MASSREENMQEREMREEVSASSAPLSQFLQTNQDSSWQEDGWKIFSSDDDGTNITARPSNLSALKQLKRFLADSPRQEDNNFLSENTGAADSNSYHVDYPFYDGDRDDSNTSSTSSFFVDNAPNVVVNTRETLSNNTPTMNSVCSNNELLTTSNELEGTPEEGDLGDAIDVVEEPLPKESSIEAETPEEVGAAMKEEVNDVVEEPVKEVHELEEASETLVQESTEEVQKTEKRAEVQASFDAEIKTTEEATEGAVNDEPLEQGASNEPSEAVQNARSFVVAFDDIASEAFDRLDQGIEHTELPEIAASLPKRAKKPAKVEDGAKTSLESEMELQAEPIHIEPAPIEPSEEIVVLANARPVQTPKPSERVVSPVLQEIPIEPASVRHHRDVNSRLTIFQRFVKLVAEKEQRQREEETEYPYAAPADLVCYKQNEQGSQNEPEFDLGDSVVLAIAPYYSGENAQGFDSTLVSL